MNFIEKLRTEVPYAEPLADFTELDDALYAALLETEGLIQIVGDPASGKTRTLCVSADYAASLCRVALIDLNEKTRRHLRVYVLDTEGNISLVLSERERDLPVTVIRVRSPAQLSEQLRAIRQLELNEDPVMICIDSLAFMVRVAMHAKQRPLVDAWLGLLLEIHRLCSATIFLINHLTITPVFNQMAIVPLLCKGRSSALARAQTVS